jgi:hypothetical protein
MTDKTKAANKLIRHAASTAILCKSIIIYHFCFPFEFGAAFPGEYYLRSDKSNYGLEPQYPEKKEILKRVQSDGCNINRFAAGVQGGY